MHGLLRNLVAPSKPQDKSRLELTVVLKKHFEQKPVAIAERLYFHRRNQRASRIMWLGCNVWLHTAYLDESMRDRFFCGLRDEETVVRRRPYIRSCKEITQIWEAAQLNVRQLKETGEVAVGFIHNLSRRARIQAI